MTLEQKYNTLLIVAASKRRLDALTLMRLYQQIHDETINWHEFSYYLDELHTRKILKCVGHTTSNMSQYLINDAITTEY